MKQFNLTKLFISTTHGLKLSALNLMGGGGGGWGGGNFPPLNLIGRRKYIILSHDQASYQ